MKLNEQLGYDKEARLLIINGDDFGLNYSVNLAIKKLLEEQKICSASLMLPAAYARDAAHWSNHNPKYDVGIHFTFTSEWEKYKWGPMTSHQSVQSLVTDEGYFHEDIFKFERHAKSSEVYQELISQMEYALQMGLKPTHADNHMGADYGRATGQHFLIETLDVCAYYGVPFRLPRFAHSNIEGVVKLEMKEILEQFVALADSKGVIIPDYLHTLPFQSLPGETLESYTKDVEHMISNLPIGVTEVYIHPSIPSEELADFHSEASKRVLEYELYNSNVVKELCDKHQVILIHWKQLQQLQRAQNPKQYPF